MQKDISFDEGYELTNPRALGTLRVMLVDPATGRTLESRTTRNIITHEAADVMAKAVVGDTSFRLTHIYFQHGALLDWPEGAPPLGLSALRTDSVANLSDLGPPAYGTTDAEEPLVSVGHSRSNEVPGRYQHNIATVVAVAGSDALNGRSVIGAGLIAQVGATPFLFAHQYFPALQKLAQFQVVGAWSIRYL